MGLIIFVQEKNQLMIKKMYFRTQDSILTKQQQKQNASFVSPKKTHINKWSEKHIKRTISKAFIHKQNTLRFGLVSV